MNTTYENNQAMLNHCSLLDTAREYVNSALSVFPIRKDGTKAPAVKEWTPFRERKADDAELTNWFANDRYGPAIVCGKPSEDLLVFDFEYLDVYQLWAARVAASGFDQIIATCPIVGTGGDGIHLYVRLDEPTPSGTRLASRPGADGKEDLLIETRGEGHYVVAAGAPAECHASKKPYTLLSGSLSAIPVISMVELHELLEIARSFDEMPARTSYASPAESYKKHSAVRDFNERGDESSLLLKHNYTLVQSKGEQGFWQKPNSSNRGHHMTTNYADSGTIFNFSSANAPFQEQRAYSKFEAFALLEFAGDLKAALDSLIAQGYGQKNQSTAQTLIDLALSKATLWHDSEDESYASISVSAHEENYALKSKQFKRWLSGSLYRSSKIAANSQQLEQAIQVLEHEARLGSEFVPTMRVAEFASKIYIDLCDDEWRVIEVSQFGWSVLATSPVKFVRRRSMSALPEPVRGGNLNSLSSLLNLPDDSMQKLYVSWILAALRPKGPYPLMVLNGEQGSAKTTAAKIAKFLIDPAGEKLGSKVQMRSAPTDAEQLSIWAKNSWVLILDNISFVKIWLSDALCRLSTGGGHSSRRLYTDDDEVSFDLQRPVILNGIEDFVSRQDLIDRAIILNLPTISNSKRKTEDEIWEEITKERPAILGVLLDALSGALRDLPSTKLFSMPRMADFALWATAAEKSLGWSQKSFIKAYEENRQESFEVGLMASPLYKPLCIAIDAKGFDGTASQLLPLLQTVVNLMDKDQDRRFLKTPSRLSGELRKIAPGLRQIGWTVNFGRGRSRLIKLRQPPIQPQIQMGNSAVDSVDASLI